MNIHPWKSLDNKEFCSSTTPKHISASTKQRWLQQVLQLIKRVQVLKKFFFSVSQSLFGPRRISIRLTPLKKTVTSAHTHQEFQCFAHQTKLHTLSIFPWQVHTSQGSSELHYRLDTECSLPVHARKHAAQLLCVFKILPPCECQNAYLLRVRTGSVSGFNSCQSWYKARNRPNLLLEDIFAQLLLWS